MTADKCKAVLFRESESYGADVSLGSAEIHHKCGFCYARSVVFKPFCRAFRCYRKENEVAVGNIVLCESFVGDTVQLSPAQYNVVRVASENRESAVFVRASH